MAKESNKKLIIWALVALVIGVVIGMIITNATTGNAERSLPVVNLKTNESSGSQQILEEIRCLCYSNGLYEGGYDSDYDGSEGGEDLFCFNLCREKKHACGEMED